MSDLYGWHPPDLVRGMLNVLIDDAIKLAEKYAYEEPQARLYDADLVKIDHKVRVIKAPASRLALLFFFTYL